MNVPTEQNCFRTDLQLLQDAGMRTLANYNGTVYLITDKRYRRAFVSAAVFEGLGFTGLGEVPTVTALPGSAADPASPTLSSPFSDGTLLQREDSTDVWIVSDGVRRKIASNAVLTKLGYTTNDVIRLSGTIFDQIGTSAAIEDATTSLCLANTTRPLDLIFVIDTAGSMWDDIANVKASATDIVSKLAEATTNFRVAVADYRDFPVSPYGGYGDYPYHVDLPFSTDKFAIINAIQSLSLGNGADWQEAVFSALIRSIQTEGLGAWRNGAAKVLMLLGDAPPHDPEPFTSYTSTLVKAAADAVDPAVIYAIAIGGDSATQNAFADLANKTNGKLFTAADATEVSKAVLTAIGEAGHEPPSNSLPSCVSAVASPNQLWPPDHKMASVHILNVVDPDGDPVSIQVAAIQQDEPLSGIGSGATTSDGDGIGTDTAQVRAERSGIKQDGRVYRIGFVASDVKGGQCTGAVLACVPHDNGANTACTPGSTWINSIGTTGH
jgi:von Willebrand factor type A domain